MGGIVDGILSGIKSALQTIVDYWIWGIFYFTEVLLLFLVDILEDVMTVFTGEKEVVYNDAKMALIDVFFNHRTIKGIYAGIAMIGIVFAFVFAIWGVIKKAGDLRGKQQGATLGSILGNLLKSIVLIFSMNAIVLIALKTTNVLTQQVSYAVSKGDLFTVGGDDIEFYEDDYAAMGQIINMLGNYSLNPSYRSRYNLNSCYNDIRPYIEYLAKRGMFDFHYVDKDTDGDGIPEPTWQSIMESIANAYNYEQEVPLDTYDDALTAAILNAMDTLQNNKYVRVLKTYSRSEYEAAKKDNGNYVPLNKIIFLAATMGNIGGTAAARNDAFNKHPSFSDGARLPFYIGEKSIYNYEQVRKVFNPAPYKTNYLLVLFCCGGLVMEMVSIILTCGVRIFNLLALYVAAPLAISSMPLDDGGKFKQWSTAFVIQLLGIVGMVLSLRLFFMFLPIIWSPDLEVSSNIIIDIVIKVVLCYTSLEAVNKVNGIFTGILADNAGYQAIYAGNMRDKLENSAAGKAMGKLTGTGVLKEGFNKEKAAKKKEDKEKAHRASMDAVEKDIAHAEKTGHHSSKFGGGKLQKGELDNMKRGLDLMKNGNNGKGMNYKDAMKQANQEGKRNQQNQEDKGRLKKNIDFAKKHGSNLYTGQKLQEGELDRMEKAYDYMDKGGLSLGEAASKASEDYAKEQKGHEDAGAKKGQQGEAGRVPPPDPEKARETASRMSDMDYYRLSADCEYAEENGKHLIGGKELKNGELGQMKEILNQYEQMHPNIPGNQNNPEFIGPDINGNNNNNGNNPQPPGNGPVQPPPPGNGPVPPPGNRPVPPPGNRPVPPRNPVNNGNVPNHQRNQV